MDASLISAGSVLAGAALQQVFLFLGKRAENKAVIQKMRRDKLEELADLLNRHQLLALEALTQRQSQSPTISLRDVHEELNQISLRVCSLVLLFFPASKGSAENFLKASVGIQNVLISGTETEMIEAARQLTFVRETILQEIEQYAKHLGFHG